MNWEIIGRRPPAVLCSLVPWHRLSGHWPSAGLQLLFMPPVFRLFMRFTGGVHHTNEIPFKNSNSYPLSLFSFLVMVVIGTDTQSFCLQDHGGYLLTTKVYIKTIFGLCYEEGKKLTNATKINWRASFKTSAYIQTDEQADNKVHRELEWLKNPFSAAWCLWQ